VPRENIVHQRQFADLGVQGLHVDCRFRRFALAVRSENAGSPFEELPKPSRDLVWVNLKLLRQRGQRLLALSRQP
jgi:hypothetical protein